MKACQLTALQEHAAVARYLNLARVRARNFVRHHVEVFGRAA
jgi:hypothetical protein